MLLHKITKCQNKMFILDDCKSMLFTFNISQFFFLVRYSGATVHLKTSSEIIIYYTSRGNGNDSNRKFSKYQNSRVPFYLHYSLYF